MCARKSEGNSAKIDMDRSPKNSCIDRIYGANYNLIWIPASIIGCADVSIYVYACTSVYICMYG